MKPSATATATHILSQSIGATIRGPLEDGLPEDVWEPVVAVTVDVGSKVIVDVVAEADVPVGLNDGAAHLPVIALMFIVLVISISFDPQLTYCAR